MENIFEIIKPHLGDKSNVTALEKGDFADSILAFPNNLHAEVIVLGSHSRKWPENTVMGSVTQKVLNHTSIPLFIGPTKKRN